MIFNLEKLKSFQVLISENSKIKYYIALSSIREAIVSKLNRRLFGIIRYKSNSMEIRAYVFQTMYVFPFPNNLKAYSENTVSKHADKG